MAAQSQPRKGINFHSCVKFQILLICGVFSLLPPCVAVMGNHAKHDLVFHLFVLNGIYEFIAGFEQLRVCPPPPRACHQMEKWGRCAGESRLNMGLRRCGQHWARRSLGKMGKLCFLVFPSLCLKRTFVVFLPFSVYTSTTLKAFFFC